MAFYLGESKVEDLRLTARGDEDVRRFQIAVDDALRVRRFERVGDLHAEGEQRLGIQGAAAYPIREHLTVEQLHDDEVLGDSCCSMPWIVQMFG